jgi:hypothetical protein
MKQKAEGPQMNPTMPKIERQPFSRFQKTVVGGPLVKTLVMTVLGVSMVVMAQAADVMEIKCNNSFEEIKDDKPCGWVINPTYMPKGTMRVLAEKAKDGKNCVEIENVGEARFSLFVQEAQGVVDGDKIKIGIYVKGSGRFRFDIYCYGATSWWGKNLPENGPFFEVNSEEWSLQTLELTIPDIINIKGEKITTVRPAIFISTNSTLQFDCFSGQIIR